MRTIQKGPERIEIGGSPMDNHEWKKGGLGSDPMFDQTREAKDNGISPLYWRAKVSIYERNGKRIKVKRMKRGDRVLCPSINQIVNSPGGLRVFDPERR